MPVTTRQALKKQIASGDTGPLYVLIGDDDSEKSAVATEFAEMVDEGLRAFSVDRSSSWIAYVRLGSDRVRMIVKGTPVEGKDAPARVNASKVSFQFEVMPVSFAIRRW